MKLFSRASEYAILSIMAVIEHDSLEGFSTRDICASAGIPDAFARKALGALAKARILSGTPGPGGGYRLMRSPSEVSLLDIVLAVDGENAFSECPLGVRCEYDSRSGPSLTCASCLQGKPSCGFSHLCPLHGLWQETKHMVVSRLRAITLEDIRSRMNGALLEISSET